MTVTVAPALAAPGQKVTVTVDRVEKPEVFIGGHDVVTVWQDVYDKNSWNFIFPEGVSPGPQPVRVSVGKLEAQEDRIDAWIESLSGSAARNVIPIPSRLLIGSVDEVTPKAIQDSLQRSVNRIRSPGFQPPQGLPPAYVRRLSQEIQLPQLNDIQIEQLSGLNLTRPTQSAPYRPDIAPKPPYPIDMDELTKYLEERWRGISRPPLILPDRYDGRFSYKVELGRVRTPAQSPVDRAQFFSLTPVVNTVKPGFSLPTPATRTDYADQAAAFRASGSRTAEDVPVCGKDYGEVSFGSLAISDAEVLLRIDGAFTVDPTGYGVPSAAVPERGEGIPPADARPVRNRLNLLETGVFKEEMLPEPTLSRNNHANSGRGVKVFVIDTAGRDQQAVLRDEFEHKPYLGSPEKSRGHGSVIGELISGSERVSGLAPGADVTYVQACTGTKCDARKVITALCDAVRQAKQESPVIVNLSLNMPYRSTTLYRVLREFTEAGGILVAAHGNRDRCESPVSVGTFKDYCNAYPADWTGTVRPGGQRPPLLYGRPFTMLDGLYSAGGWRSVGQKPLSVAAYNREVAETSSDDVYIPTSASRYVPGEFFLKDRDGDAMMAYLGTSFAAPVLTALIANWLSPGTASPEDNTTLSQPTKRKPVISHYTAQTNNQRLRWDYLGNIRERLVDQQKK
ncbi:S8 family serine peptidase [uncultured Deinococcus sp.]|uniref:S8 family serine peptidase n=1 Tax=uncultured Deinococcus sp. TaxID=158789 RepID=UPI0025D95C6F|nr:S8 family serine peptidase [uncultured Deinococcus sp.]